MSKSHNETIYILLGALAIDICCDHRCGADFTSRIYSMRELLRELKGCDISSEIADLDVFENGRPDIPNYNRRSFYRTYCGGDRPYGPARLADIGRPKIKWLIEECGLLHPEESIERKEGCAEHTEAHRTQRLIAAPFKDKCSRKRVRKRITKTHLFPKVLDTLISSYTV